MTDKQYILSVVEPYFGKKELLISNQDTSDIVYYILKEHATFANQYDLFADIFDGNTAMDVANNLFDFVKKNIPYEEESEHEQTINSPAAILSKKVDCKSYALFIASCIDAINRMHPDSEKIPFAYRFAGYNSEDIEHVFVVLYPNTNNEIWVDPCLNSLNEKKVPYFYIDKKPKKMLYKVSGTRVGNNDWMQLINDANGFISNLFGQSDPNSDWMGWDGLDDSIGAPHGQQAAYWLYHGLGDTRAFNNVMAYFKNKPNGIIDAYNESVRSGYNTDGSFENFSNQVKKFTESVSTPDKASQLASFVKEFLNPSTSGTSGNGSGIVPTNTIPKKNNTPILLYIGIGLLIYKLAK